MQAPFPQARGLSRTAHTCPPSILVPFRRPSSLPCRQQKYRAHPVHGLVPRCDRGHRICYARSQKHQEDNSASQQHPKEAGRPSAWWPDLKAAAGGALLLGIAFLSYARPANASARYESAAGVVSPRLPHIDSSASAVCIPMKSAAGSCPYRLCSLQDT